MKKIVGLLAVFLVASPTLALATLIKNGFISTKAYLNNQEVGGAHVEMDLQMFPTNEHFHFEGETSDLEGFYQSFHFDDQANPLMYFLNISVEYTIPGRGSAVGIHCSGNGFRQGTIPPNYVSPFIFIRYVPMDCE